ncbi:DUF7793 family protein [Paenarthrobacter histidinolovorans]|uniref:DUF7793 family protein n=1 Tax=Paenarthrobacter histidinolovorans TaxID=43664 RepID=UPI00166AD6E9|nr:STAS/SEC14 domain-containing protein [Paenarthrobacter histidinolovorans]GGJ22879.1 hypothetical protein GCM10010052_19960 [Paenarthrobacter histidinolovorans]
MEPVTFEGGKGSVELGDDDVFYLLWKAGSRIEARDAVAAMETVNGISANKSHPMLVDMARIVSLSRQARAAFASPCAASRIALLGDGPVDRVLAMWSPRLHDTPCPTRFFTSRPEAMKWLLLQEREVPARISRKRKPTR